MEILNSISSGTLISWVILGLIAGYIIHLMDPREVRGGILGTVITGLVGALVGGLLSGLYFGFTPTELNFTSMVVAAIGGLLLAILQRWVFGMSVERPERLRTGRVVYFQQLYTPSVEEMERERARRGRSRKMVSSTQVQKFLVNMDYPATREELIEEARSEGARQNVLDTLKQLPDKDYNGPAGVNRELDKVES